MKNYLFITVGQKEKNYSIFISEGILKLYEVKSLVDLYAIRFSELSLIKNELFRGKVPSPCWNGNMHVGMKMACNHTHTHARLEMVSGEKFVPDSTENLMFPYQ